MTRASKLDGKVALFFGTSNNSNARERLEGRLRALHVVGRALSLERRSNSRTVEGVTSTTPRGQPVAAPFPEKKIPKPKFMSSAIQPAAASAVVVCVLNLFLIEF